MILFDMNDLNIQAFLQSSLNQPCLPISPNEHVFMPQFDTITFSIQVVNTLITFGFYYLIIVAYVLLSFTQILKFRSKKIFKNLNSKKYLEFDLKNSSNIGKQTFYNFF